MPDRRHLQVRCPSGDPSRATIHLDGKQLPFVSRIQITLDTQTGEAAATLTIPAALLDLDVDARALITSHSTSEEQP